MLGYTLGRGWIEHLRSDYAHHFLGLRLNDWASILCFAGALVFFLISQRRHPGKETAEELYWPHFQPYDPEGRARADETEADAETEAETKADADAAAEQEPESGPQADPAVDPDADPDPCTDRESGPEPDSAAQSEDAAAPGSEAKHEEHA